MRHGGGALLALGEKFLGLADLCALQVADLDGQPLDRRGDHGERDEECGVAVARDDLGRDRLRFQAKLFRNVSLHARVDIGEGADGAGDFRRRDLGARSDEPLPAAGEFGIGIGELQPEGGRLGMDAVAAADGDGVLMLDGAALQRGEQGIEVGKEDVGGPDELDVQASVQDVRRSHALMHEARFRAYMLGKAGQERDDVVLDLALDGVDAVDVEAAALADRLRRLLRNDAELGHGLGRKRFDLQPDAESRLRRPDGGHFRAGIAWDHGGASVGWRPAAPACPAKPPHPVAFGACPLPRGERAKSGGRHESALSHIASLYGERQANSPGRGLPPQAGG